MALSNATEPRASRIRSKRPRKVSLVTFNSRAVRKSPPTELGHRPSLPHPEPSRLHPRGPVLLVAPPTPNFFTLLRTMPSRASSLESLLAVLATSTRATRSALLFAVVRLSLDSRSGFVASLPNLARLLTNESRGLSSRSPALVSLPQSRSSSPRRLGNLERR